MPGKRIGLIINPYAKLVKKKYLADGRRFWEVMLAPGRYQLPDGIEQIPFALENLLEEEIDVLGILGGDGTMHIVLQELLKMNPGRIPAILPFRGGTINAVCNNIGIKDEPQETLRKFLEFKNTEISQTFKHLLRIEEAERKDFLQYGFTFANGVFPKIFQEYYSYKEPGFGAALRLILKVFTLGLVNPGYVSRLISPVEMKVLSRGKEIISGRIRVLAVSTLESPTLWWKPFGPELDGRPCFHYLANAMSNREVIFNMFDLFVGRCQHPRHLVGEASQLEVECDTGYVLDGELYRVGEHLWVKIELGPALRFMVV